MTRGRAYLYTSSVIYGVIPVFAKAAYAGGANGITLSFLRAFLTVPLLLAIAAGRGALKINARTLKKVCVLGICNALSITLLYVSYNYISAGLALTLHFVYPVLIFTAEFFIYKKRIGRMEMLSLALTIAGIILFADINGGADIFGAVLALVSGAFYAAYVLYLEKSGIKDMDQSALTLYVCIIAATAVLVYAAATNALTLRSMDGWAWFWAAVISAASSLVAIPLFQLGVRYTNPRTAAIISTAEPITGVIAGAIVLGEPVGVTHALGCALVLAGVAVGNLRRE